MIPRKLTTLLCLACLLWQCGAVARAQDDPELDKLKRSNWRITNVAHIDLAISPANKVERARVWQMTGPFGGDVKALVIDPRNADRVLLGTNDGQLFRSTDGGQVWRRLRPGIKAPGFAVTFIHFDTAQPGTLFIGVKQVKDAKDDATGGGLYVTRDNGDSWREIAALREHSVLGFAQAAKDPDVLVTVARDGIYHSADHGATWRRITPENDRELTGFHSAAIDPRDPQTIFVGTWHLPWKTTDSGATWKLTGMKETGMIDDSDIFSIRIDPANPDAMWMSACSGIYRSHDGSANWAKVKGIPYSARRTHTIYQHPTQPEIVFAGTIEGLWRSVKGGAPDTWRQVTSRLVINAVAVHPDRPERVFVATDNYGVLVSNDGGENYELSNAGFVSRYVNVVVADRTERGRIYAGVLYDAANGGFFISEDGGLTWQQAVEGMGVRDVFSIQQSEANPQTLYAGTNSGLFRSDDRGRTWTPVKKAEPVVEPALEANAADTSTQTGGPNSGNAPLRPSPRSVVKTSARTTGTQTRGQRPVTPKKSAPLPPIEAQNTLADLQSQVFMLAPLKLRANENDAPASAISENGTALAPAGFIAATWDGLFRSADEKQGWQALKLPTRENAAPHESERLTLKALATSPHAPGLILLGTDAGVFLSRDNGDTFNAVPLGDKPLRVYALAIDPRTAETLYVGTADGFFRSLDGGRTWEQRGGGMPMTVEVTALSVNPLNPDELYLSDHLRGTLYHSLDRGKNWEPLDISALPSVQFKNLAADPFNPNRLYVGSYSGGVYVMSRQ